MDYMQQFYDLKIPKRAKLLFMYLDKRADKNRQCWFSQKRIAHDLSMSVKTVQRAQADLIEAGYLKVEARFRPNHSRTSNLFTVKKLKV